MDIVLLSLFLMGFVLAVFGIRQNIKIKTDIKQNEAGQMVYTHPANQRKLALFLLIAYSACLIFSGIMLTFELSGKQEKNRRIAEIIFFQNSANAKDRR